MRVAGSICVFAVLAWQTAAATPPSLAGRVVDENGVAVAGARVEVSSGSTTVTATSDSAGNFNLEVPSPGGYQIRAERLGFFIYSGKSVAFQEGPNHLTITLNHLQELTESVEVKYSPPVIDTQEPDERKQLNAVEIMAVPYPASQDMRSALPLMPGVVQDASGNLHFNGGATDQTNVDERVQHFRPTPAGWMRVSIEAVRSLISRQHATPRKEQDRPARWTSRRRWATTTGGFREPISSRALPAKTDSRSTNGRRASTPPALW
jgi:hypothetical protein